MFVLKPDEIKVEDWSTKLPTDFRLVGIIYTKESKLGQKPCTVCERENETKSAYSWCVNCSEALCKKCNLDHRRNKTTRHHKLVDIDHVELPRSGTDAFCVEHPDKKVEAYCLDHAAECCTACILLRHRKCEDVKPIEDAAEEIKQSKGMPKVEETFCGFKFFLEALLQNRVEGLKNFDDDIVKTKADVESLFKELSSHLTYLKTNIMFEIGKAEKEIRPELQDERDEMNSKLVAVQNDIALLQNHKKNVQPAQLLRDMKTLSEQERILEKYLRDHGQKLIEMRVSLKSNEKLLELRNMPEFGKVDVQGTLNDVILPSATTTKTCMSSVEPSLSSAIHKEFDVEGVSLLENGQIVLSCKTNKREELQDIRCPDVLSSLSLPGRPYGIKMIGATDGGVVLEKYGLILFRIQDSKILKVNEIKTKVNYDFVHLKEEFYFGCDREITAYDNKGNRVRDISVKNNVGYMAVRDDTSMCYTVYNKRELHCITMHGVPVFTYTDDNLRCALGVTVDHTGFIYVCGYNSMNVHQLGHDGKLQRVIFDKLPSYPNCICFSHCGDKAIIGCDGKVLVFNLL
ncbi:hypothetical protein FSP39_009593 [Pinctada imbricata]|uniref:B box-type domain-containing protein n=1 Tax=Pinctada imbricata TaxID=66713 RepID=A0AA88YMS2_PINIB|nr:hypothetical protein FSP39_009593 [Pinctada imbricata]